MAVRVFSWVAFPLVLAASTAWGLVRVEEGIAPSVAILPPLLLSFAFVAVAERLLPLHASWLHGRGDVPVDAGLALTSGAITNGLTPFLLVLGIGAGGWLSRWIDAPLWPVDASLLLQLGLALVVAELPKYWLHRIEHEWEWLWRIHATHHSAGRLYWLNAARFHPIDLGLDHIVGVGTLALLGCGEAVIGLFALVSAVHGVFQHANLPLRCGPLNWVFSMAELHRWHHSPDPAVANHNYGQNLIIWDVVFGTRYLPRDSAPNESVGIGDMPGFPSGFLANLAAPFRWARVVRESRTPPVSA
jgi:sterol desaturase/sphingolipid hydroxylase (fatty acid hydroxylase superfamily)